jgi:indole-3-glycerol phosphate synthase
MILDTIVAEKQREVKKLRDNGVHAPGLPVEPPRGFRQALISFSGVALIAEAKKASPSKGLICPDFDPKKIARNYQQAGAQAMSVLTDEKFFQGSLDFIPLVRQQVNLPILRKDFIIDEIQIKQAALYGADAILLIAAILDPYQLRDFRQAAQGRGMDVLVEVHDEKELETTMNSGADLVGINNRNLKDFSVDLETTFRLKKEIPAEIPLVSESGIKEKDDVERCLDAGVTAVLVGETLMRAEDQQQMVRELMGR